jgi:hypothetical protein
MAGDSAWKQVTSISKSGAASAYGPGSSHVTDNWLTSIDSISVPAGNTTAKLSFFHAFSFESGFDGGLIERSVDGGAFADFAPAEFLMGAPTTTINSSFGNPIAGRKAWTDVSGPGAVHPFIHTVVDLSPYAGHEVTIRFHLGTDSSAASQGWWVDDVDAALAPEAATGAATGVTATSADIDGVVSPHSTATSFHVLYGPTAAYGALAPVPDAVVGSDAGANGVSQTLTGLTPATTYHYRVVATYVGGSSAGADQTFSTAAAPPPEDPAPVPAPPVPPTPPSTPLVPPPFAGIELGTFAAKASKARTVKLTLACPTAAVGNCTGTDALATARKLRVAKRKKPRILSLGKATFSIAPGSSGTVTIRLSRATAKLLAAKRVIRATQTAVASDSRNVRVTTTGATKLARPAVKRRSRR